MLRRELKVLLSSSWCELHKSYALYIPGVGLSPIFHMSDKTTGPSGTEGFKGSKKVLQNDRPIYSPEVHCAWPLTHYNAGDKFWNEHWSKVISQRTPVLHNTAKPPAKFFSSRHISGNLPVCLLTGHFWKCQSKKSNKCKKCANSGGLFLFFFTAELWDCKQGWQGAFSAVSFLQRWFFPLSLFPSVINGDGQTQMIFTKGQSISMWLVLSTTTHTWPNRINPLALILLWRAMMAQSG